MKAVTLTISFLLLEPPPNTELSSFGGTCKQLIERGADHAIRIVVHAVQNLQSPTEREPQGGSLFGRRCEEPKTTGKPVFSLRHGGGLSIFVRRIAVTQDEGEVAAKGRPKLRGVDRGIAQAVGKRYRLSREGIPPRASSHGSSEARLRQKQHQPMHELAAAREPDNVVVTGP